MGLHHHLLAIILCYQKPHLPANFSLKVYHVYKFQQHNKLESHELRSKDSKSHGLFVLERRSFVPRKFVVGFETFSTLNFSADDWKQSEKKRCWFMLRLQFLTTPGVEAGLFYLHEENCYRFSFGWKLYKQGPGMETRFTNNKTPDVGFNSNIRSKQIFFY